MEVKLDLKDKKILYLLLQNASIPLKKLASSVDLSKNAVTYRINRLKQLGVIERFHPVLNYQSLGYYTYDMFIKYRATEADEKRIKNYVKRHTSILWAVSLFGKWDLFLQIIAGSEFEKIVKEILEYFGKNLEQYEVKLSVSRLKIHHQIFDIKGLHFFETPKPIKNKVEIDDIDRKILSYLSSVDALANYRDIAKSVEASPETTRNRIKRLFKENVILYSMPFIVHQKIGLRSYIVNITFRNLTTEKEKELEQYILSNSIIKIAFRSLGKLEVYFWVVIKDIEELEKLLREMKNRFFNEILDTEYNFVTEELKLNYFPEALVK